MQNSGENKKILLFGGNRRGEDGPLLSFALNAARQNNKVTIFTEDFHWNLPTGNGQTLGQKLENAKTDNIEWIVSPDITTQLMEKHMEDNAVGLLINAVWIIKQNTIDLFEGRLFNYHNAKLPQERGAAAYSWKILSQNKKGALTIHKVVSKLDAGDIVKQLDLVFPDECRIPSDFYKHMEKHEASFLMEFIEGKGLVSVPQDETESTYMPRLHTLTNGLINWNWSSKEIELFINAFDDPHEGASTFLGSQKLHLKKCFPANENENFHPFQAGLVYRKNSESLFVASNGTGLEIREVRDTSGDDAFAQVKLGQRFHTPSQYLDEAKSAKIICNSEGIDIKRSQD